MHAQRGIVAHARAVAAGFGYDAPDCVALAMLPLCGVFGYDSALGALAGGAPVVLQEAFDAGEAARLVERHRVTHANGSDAMVLRLLAAAPDPPLREAGFAAFDGDPRAVVDAGDAAGTTAYMCYGSTEVQALLAHAPQDGPPERRAIAGGTPVSPETTVRVAGDGELEVRGPSVMAGYLGDERPDLTDDGFLRTGDLGRELDGGGFAFTARRGDALRLGGFLVSPREIEAFLEQGDDIAEAAVVAVEHEGACVPSPSPSPATAPCSTRPARSSAAARASPPSRCRAGCSSSASCPPPTPPTAARCSAPRCAGSRPKRCRKLQPRREERAMSAPSSTGPSTTDPPRQAEAAGAAEHDWKHLAETPEFQRLHSNRRRFTLIGMAIQTTALVVVMGLFGWSPETMGEPAIGSITWALLAGTFLVLLTFALAIAYSRKARQWEEMAAAALEHAGEKVEPTRRFAR